MKTKEISILFIFLIIWATIIPLSESLAMGLYQTKEDKSSENTLVSENNVTVEGVGNIFLKDSVLETDKQSIDETSTNGQKMLYGTVLTISFLLMFNLLTIILENARFNRKIENKEFSSGILFFNEAAFDIYKENKKEIGIVQINSRFFNLMIIGMLITIVLIGFIFNIIPLYLGEQQDIGFKDIISSIFAPSNYILRSIGGLYLNNIQLSRMILLPMLPAIALFYLYGISNIDKLSEKINQMSQ